MRLGTSHLRGKSDAYIDLRCGPAWCDGRQLGTPRSTGAASGRVVASATGSGHVHVGPGGAFFRTFSVTAREYADGTDKGQAQVQNRFGPFGPIHIEIDCLRVIGTIAFVSRFVKHIGEPSPMPEGTTVFFAV